MNEFHYEFTTKELKYLLFGKKVCKLCGTKLVKQKTMSIQTGAEVKGGRIQRGYFLPDNAQVKCYGYSYVGPSCGQVCPLADLAN